MWVSVFRDILMSVTLKALQDVEVPIKLVWAVYACVTFI